MPGGNVTTGHEELTLRTLGPIYRSQSQFEDLVIANVKGSPIRLRDVGRVEDGTKEQRSFSRLNGVPTVTLEIRRQSGANTIEVIKGIKEALPRVAAQLPEDVKLESHSRPIALHRSSASRNSDTPGSGQYSRESGGVALHAVLALDADRGGRDSVFGDFNIRHDARARLHAQQRDDARAGVDGRRRNRRCDRRA